MHSTSHRVARWKNKKWNGSCFNALSLYFFFLSFTCTNTAHFSLLPVNHFCLLLFYWFESRNECINNIYFIVYATKSDWWVSAAQWFYLFRGNEDFGKKYRYTYPMSIACSLATISRCSEKCVALFMTRNMIEFSERFSWVHFALPFSV